MTDVSARYTAQLDAVCMLIPAGCPRDVPVYEVDSTEGLCAPAGPACYRLDERVIYVQADNTIDPWLLLTHEWIHAALVATGQDDVHGPVFQRYMRMASMMRP